MKKPTPNPPESSLTNNPTSPYESVDSRKLHDAAERALDYYLTPAALQMPPAAESMYLANPKCDTESLLVSASETLGSASIMLHNFADSLTPAHRKTALGIAHVVMLGELAVNQALSRAEVT